MEQIQEVQIRSESFLYEERGPVAVITFNRPERLNALTFEVYRELTATFELLARKQGVRAVVITGKGRGFCSGGDVNDIIGELFNRDAIALREFTRLTCKLILNIRKLNRPVIAAINGTVAGAGAVIALASDFRIACDSAKIAFLFVKVGLSGADMGAGFLLPRIVGLAKATELLFTGDLMSAEDALRIGLYNKVVSTQDLENEAMALAERLASGPAYAIAMTKASINREMGLSLESAIDLEAENQALCMLHPDFREAYDAFLEKRPPIFNK